MKSTIRFLLAATMLLPAASPVLAQVAPYGEKSMGDPAQDRLPDILNTVKIEQRLGERRRRRSAMQKSTLRCIALGSPGKASSSSRIRRPRRRF